MGQVESQHNSCSSVRSVPPTKAADDQVVGFSENSKPGTLLMPREWMPSRSSLDKENEEPLPRPSSPMLLLPSKAITFMPLLESEDPTPRAATASATASACQAADFAREQTAELQSYLEQRRAAAAEEAALHAWTVRSQGRTVSVCAEEPVQHCSVKAGPGGKAGPTPGLSLAAATVHQAHWSVPAKNDQGAASPAQRQPTTFMDWPRTPRCAKVSCESKCSKVKPSHKSGRVKVSRAANPGEELGFNLEN